jgi:hypothetical protein
LLHVTLPLYIDTTRPEHIARLSRVQCDTARTELPSGRAEITALPNRTPHGVRALTYRLSMADSPN